MKSNEGYRHIFSYIFLIIQKIIKIPEEAVNSLKRFEEDKEIDCKKKSTSNACLKNGGSSYCIRCGFKKPVIV